MFVSVSVSGGVVIYELSPPRTVWRWSMNPSMIALPYSYALVTPPPSTGLRYA